MEPISADEWEGMPRWERYELGRALRRQGLSYGEIMRLLPVRKGTLASWCSDIRLSSEQVDAIRRRTSGRRGVPRDTQRRRRLEVERMQREAAARVAELVREPLWVAGVCLYWAEGAKTKRMLSVSNTDAGLLRTFVAWTRCYHDIHAEFVLALHLHEGNSEAGARAFWRASLGLPDVPFHKTHIKPGSTRHRKNRLPQGVCRVLMRRSANAWVRTMAWIGAVEEQLVGRYPGPGSLAQLARATDS